MNETESKQKYPESVELEEKLSRKILRSVFAQFQSLSDALLELVDNAFDEFDGFHGGSHLYVDIWLTKNSITVDNRGGKGMGTDELQTWLEWGDAHKTNAIGEYGQGGKAAMGYIGNSWVVQCKHWNEPWLWEIRENNWDDTSVDHKKYKATRTKFDGKSDIGYCSFQIRKLKKHRVDIKRIRETLANTYRKLLEDGKATITINGEAISPLSLPLYDGYKIQRFKLSLPEAARRLSMPPSSIGNWLKAHKAGKLGEVGKSYRPLTEIEMELARMKKELAEVKMERDILKKAAAYFARESLPGTRQ